MIGFIGLGVMGQPIALNLQRSGVPLIVWNRTPQRCDAVVAEGALRAESADDVFREATTIIVMLANEAASDLILGRGEEGFADRVAGKRLIFMGTNSAAWSSGLSRDLEAAGAQYIEAPVSGSRQPAIAGTLVAMIAGASAAARLEVAALLKPACRQIFDAGQVPNALRLKLSVNLFLITMVAGLAESAALARRLGVSWPLLQSVLDAGPMASDVSRMKLAKLVAADFSVQASIRDVAMNCRLVASAADEAAFAAPVLRQSMRLFEDAEGRGCADLDMIAVIAAMDESGLPAQSVQP